MMAWMNAETLQLTSTRAARCSGAGAARRSGARARRRGERQWVRAAYYDCDGDVLLFVVEQDGQGACHTGEHSCFFRRSASTPTRRASVTACRMIRPDQPRRVPEPGPRPHRRAGVGRAAGRPRDAGRRLRQARAATAPASCSSRSSTASAGAGSRSSAATRRPRSSLRDGRGRRRRRRCPKASRSTGACSPRSRRCCTSTACPGAPRPPAAAGRRRRLPRLRRDPRGRAPPGRAPRRPRPARRGHERHRRAWPPSTTGASGSTSSRACPCSGRSTTPTSTPPTTRPVARVDAAVADLGRPLAVRAGAAARPRRAAARGALDDARRHVPGGRRGGQGAHPGRRHLPGRAGPALRPRARRRPVRRLPRPAPGEPQPVHVLPAPPRDHHRRVVARADGAGRSAAR